MWQEATVVYCMAQSQNSPVGTKEIHEYRRMVSVTAEMLTRTLVAQVWRYAATAGLLDFLYEEKTPQNVAHNTLRTKARSISR